MIAKLCTHAPTRAEAIAAMARSLDAFYIDGIQHNVPFLSAIMENPRWQSGALSTGFIAEEFPERLHRPWIDARDRRDAGRGRNGARSCREPPQAHDQRADERRQGVKFAHHAHREAGQATTSPWTSDGRHRCAGRCLRLGAGAAGLLGRPRARPGHGAGEAHPQRLQAVAIAAWCWRPMSTPAREAELARLMPEKAVADTSKKLLCPMPGLVISIAAVRRPGREGGRAAGHRRGHEDGEHPARRARCDGEEAINAKQGDSLAVDAVIMEFV